MCNIHDHHHDGTLEDNNGDEVFLPKRGRGSNCNVCMIKKTTMMMMKIQKGIGQSDDGVSAPNGLPHRSSDSTSAY